jgi:23S rRNA U2552 (ribose-2'-O)-methylase RlmE/FtsJ
MLEILAEFNLDNPGKSGDAYSVYSEGRGRDRIGWTTEGRSEIVGMRYDLSSKIHKRATEHVFNKMRTFHLAEGPGGFIEAICNKRNNSADEYFGMTIIIDENDDNVPAWNKTGHYLSQHPNIHIEYGIDGTGNLLHIDNFEYCVKKYGSSMDLVTADGGFDFSKDFNGQEISITNLLWGQVCYALCLQTNGGSFVLKIFDIFYEHTVDILYILSAFYEEVNVCKLKTSRVGNSEKYVVCKQFLFDSNRSFYPKIYESFLQIKSDSFFTSFRAAFSPKNEKRTVDYFFERSEEEEDDDDDIVVSEYGKNTVVSLIGESDSLDSMKGLDLPGGFFSRKPGGIQDSDENHFYILRLLNIKIPRHFTKCIEEMNAIFGQQQIENIHYTLSLIDKQPKLEKLDQLAKQNISKCINWCIEHSVIYNNLVTVNMFENYIGAVKNA